MKEIVTGSCLLAIAILMVMLAGAIASSAENSKHPAAVPMFLFFLVLAIAFGFSGCGILIRGVIR